MKRRVAIITVMTVALVLSVTLYFKIASSREPVSMTRRIDGTFYNLTNELKISYQERLIERLQNLFDRAKNDYGVSTAHYITFVASSTDFRLGTGGMVDYYPISPDFDIYLAFNGKLPAWLCSGLEDYWYGNGKTELWDKDTLSAWLNENTGGEKPEFGDAWFVPDFFDGACTPEVKHAAYAIVALLAETDDLEAFIRLALEDMDSFIEQSNAWVKRLKNDSFREDEGYYFYSYDKGFTIFTKQGKYAYNPIDSNWKWENIRDYTSFMDLAIAFEKDFFRFNYTGRLDVEIQFQDNGRDLKAGRSFNGYIALYRMRGMRGPYIFPHEAVHLFCSLSHIGGKSAFFQEGLAEFGAIQFEAQYPQEEYYSDYRGNPLNADVHAKYGYHLISDSSTLIKNLGKSEWSYADGASFFCYIYDNYGIEKLMTLYNANGDNQIIEEPFGKTFQALIADWRAYLWPDGEPESWWG